MIANCRKFFDVPWHFGEPGAPAFEPVTPDEFSAHSHVDAVDGQEKISDYLASAVGWVENEVSRAIASRTQVLYLDYFPSGAVEWRLPPLASLTSVVYLDGSGQSVTLSPSLYRVSLTGKPARITPAYGQSWPTTYPVVDAIQITGVCGYANAEAVPACAKQAIRYMAALMFEHREPTETDLYIVQRMLDPIRWGGSV